MGIELESEDFTIENIIEHEIKNVPIEKITTRGYVLLLILFSDSGEEDFTDFNDNVYYESKMLFLPQGSLNRLHEPDYTRKDAFLIGTTLYIYGKSYTRTMYDDEFGSADIAICTLTDI